MDISNRFQLAGAARALVPLLGLLLGGCAVATPFRGPGFTAGKVTSVAPDQDVVVVLTNARVHRALRGPFDAQTSKVVDSLPNQPGLVGYSVRRELLGDEVWTMTVWKSEADRARFVASNSHRTAMIEGSPALKSARFSRVLLPAKDIPISWDRAKQILDEQSRRY